MRLTSPSGNYFDGSRHRRRQNRGRGTLPKGGLPMDAQPYSVARRMDTAEVPPAGSSVSPTWELGDQSFVQEFALSCRVRQGQPTIRKLVKDAEFAIAVFIACRRPIPSHLADDFPNLTL